VLPEERELARLDAQQKELEEQLVYLEYALASVVTETEQFKQRYYRQVGLLYAELDELDAMIDTMLMDRAPDNPELRAKAKASEEQAKKSAEEAGLAEAEATSMVVASPELKHSYRRAVKLMHPDLVLSEHERLRRTALMAEINLAYERRDLNAIEKIIGDYREDPEAIVGEDVGSRIVKTIRRIARLRRRIGEVEKELEALKKTDIYALKDTTALQEANGSDPIGDLTRDLTRQIREKKQRVHA
jgi:hypothetical protein